MLARLRASLGRSAAGPAPDELEPFTAPVPAAEGARLVAQFGEELRTVGGELARVHSADEVGAYVKGLLPANVRGPVAVSGGQLVGELGVRDWLLSRDTEVVDTLAEFAGREGSESQSKSEDAGALSTREQYQRILLECAVGVTAADYALADTGTLVLASGGEQHRLISLLPPVHVCLLSPARILPSLTQLLAHFGEEFYSRGRPPRALTCITGPSRTADIEQTITMGVHGPRSLHVLIYSPAEGVAL